MIFHSYVTVYQRVNQVPRSPILGAKVCDRPQVCPGLHHLWSRHGIHPSYTGNVFIHTNGNWLVVDLPL